MGSMASTEPAPGTVPPGCPRWAGTGPCACSCRCRDRRSRRRCRICGRSALGRPGSGLDGVRDVGEPVARHHRGDARLHRFLVARDSASSTGMSAPTPNVIAESPCQPSTIAPQSMDTRSPARGFRWPTESRARRGRSPTSRCWPGSRDSPGTTGCPRPRITDSAISSRARVDPGRGGLVHGQQRGGDQRPAAAIASSSPALRCATTLRLRSPGRRSWLLAERAQRTGEHLVEPPTASTVCRLLWL